VFLQYVGYRALQRGCAAMTPRAEETQPLTGARCLIVDDEFLIALDYERILQAAGAARIATAGTLARARAAIAQQGPFALALLDIDVNGESSLPLARELAAAGTAVVFTTGLSSRMILPGEVAGAIVLEKPFQDSALLAAIRQSLGRP